MCQKKKRARMRHEVGEIGQFARPGRSIAEITEGVGGSRLLRSYGREPSLSRGDGVDGPPDARRARRAIHDQARGRPHDQASDGRMAISE